jgi:aminodeoxychorismate synthase component I
MPEQHVLPWSHPLAFLPALAERADDWALFYSGLHTHYSGRYSWLALDAREAVSGQSWQTLEDALQRTGQPSRWAGYLGYGLKDDLERLPPDHVDDSLSLASAMPDMMMRRFALWLCFDHMEQKLTAWAEDPEALQFLPVAATCAPDAQIAAPVLDGAISSSMSDAEYLAKVEEILQAIRAGELYQANLTRKYSGRFAEKANPLALFTRLTQVSPAPYSALMRLGNYWILSSSPECFLTINEQGTISTRPIKGTIRRSEDEAEDQRLRHHLATSEKDRAENLMIVDLMRNDLARVSVPGSVNVPNLYQLQSFQTLHHLDSLITAQRAPDKSSLDVIKACFPPGSMTGAPKIRAMEYCTRLEWLKRGVYSGAIGWLDSQGSADFSVVIRTLIVEGNRFEFQVGGGIVYESIPQQELEETHTKAQGIMRALGLASL